MYNTQIKNGFYMPAEYAPHSGTIIIWPEREGSWIYGAKHARPTFANVIRAIAKNEVVYVAVSKTGRPSCEQLLKDEIEKKSVVLLDIPTDDSWARDVAPTFVTDGNKLKGIDWLFNAWGGDYNGLYESWDKDDAFAGNICNIFGYERLDAHPFILEGGSIHSNGKGTIITTEECLLSCGRNSKLTKEQIEDKLKFYLGADRVVWLPYGIDGDETDGHVDNICAFCGDNSVLLAWTDEEGEQNRRCKADLKVLEDNGFFVIKLPLPKKDVQINEYECNGFTYSIGEVKRVVGEKLAASYANFYVCNGSVIVPTFDDENDAVACEILKKAFPDRQIVPIYARDIIVGGGNIHCITQQIPKV
jgi:agmatine deiminase